MLVQEKCSRLTDRIWRDLDIVKTVKLHIMKTRLYNIDPLKPHFYTVKLGFTGV